MAAVSTRRGFDDLADTHFFTTLDMFSGYWQIMLADGLKEKTARICKQVTHHFEFMPSRLMNAPPTSQRTMYLTFGTVPFLRVYFEDIIFSQTLD